MIRKAKTKDAYQIAELINHYAKKGLLLPRSLNSIFENLRDFWIYEGEGKILGVVALHLVWEDLAEIKSLAVREGFRGKGIGRKLVERALKEAKDLGVKKVFSLTYAKEFFLKLGFREIDKGELPQKVWGECINCPKFPNCDEVALLKEL